MNRKASVLLHKELAGTLSETDKGYEFVYEETYFNKKEKSAVSNTLPLALTVYKSNVLFPFFDGLIPEGWLLDIAETNWKLSSRDRFGLLLVCCKNCIGAVSVVPQY